MSAYTEAVERNIWDLKFVSTGGTEECPECIEAGYTERHGDEGSFYWTPCGICGSPLGGDRYIWHWIDEDGAMMHEDSACTDCVLYLANGDEPEDWK